VGIGTALVDAKSVEAGDWAGLEARARRLAASLAAPAAAPRKPGA
jgi:hypothetical protein